CSASSASRLRRGRWGSPWCPVLLLLLVRLAGGDLGHVDRRFADVVDEAVLERLLGIEPAVPVAVLVDLLDGLARLGCGDLRETALHVEDELRLGLDVARRAAESAVRL